MDRDGYPHISYCDRTNDDLKYAYWDGVEWQIQTVDSEGWVGFFTSLVLDSNDYPHISYYDSSNKDLKYAYWDGAEWQIQTVDSEGDVGRYTSLALERNDYPHISYHADTNYDLKYAYWDGGGWQIQIVEDGKENFVGSYTSLALDSNDYPHISYYDSVNDDLKYTYWDGAEWQIEMVDGGGLFGETVGSYTSLALDSNDYPHISYCDGTNHALKYAYWDGDRAEWQREIVDSGGVGWHTSLALDRDGYPHISYYDYTNGDLKYATSAPLSGAINGVVTDRQTGEPIKWALVIAIQKPIKVRTFTDRDGYYEITDLEPGIYWVIVFKKGYKAGIAKVEVVAGETTTRDFSLKPK